MSTTKHQRALLDLSTQMDWHIRFNHYPPPKEPAPLVTICCNVVRRYNGLGEPADTNLDYKITMPNGGELTAFQVVEAFHLHDFLERGMA